MPLYSIIIPVYNVEKYLPECIESVLKQSFRNYELILVDDGSTDMSPQICDRYASEDARIRVIHKNNGGANNARKEGMNIAAGDYILVVDSDDYISSELLARLNGVLQKYSPDMIAFNFVKVDENRNALLKVKNRIDEGFYNEDQIQQLKNKLLYDAELPYYNTGNLIYSLWSKAIKRELVRACQNPVPDTIRRGEDLAVVMATVCRCKSLFVLDFEGYYYRQVATSVEHTFAEGEFERSGTLLNFLYKNAGDIRRENIDSYGFHAYLQHTVEAARNHKDYKTYKRYMLQASDPTMEAAVKAFNPKGLYLKYRLQAYALKLHLYPLIWLVYHNR